MSTDLVQQKAMTIKKLLEASKKEIEAALPAHLGADRMMRIAMTEIRKTPKLLDCTAASLIGSIIQAAQVGLEPGGALGHCYLVPYGAQCQLIIGYRGLLQLADRSEKISNVMARSVYDGDSLAYEYGLEEGLRHVPGDASKRGQLTHVYCIVKLKDGSKMFDVMSKAEVDAIRNRSKASGSGPWVTDYEAMAKKTVVRRMFKFMPASIELQKAVGLDELSETEKGQSFEGVIETEKAETKSLQDKIKERDEPEAKVEVKTEITNTPEDRDVLAFNLIKDAEEVGIGAFALEEKAKAMFGRKVAVLTTAEMKKLAEAVQQEATRK